MSYNYAPNYMSLIQALQSGGIEGASALKSARSTRGLASRGVNTEKTVSDSEVESFHEQLLNKFSNVREENENMKAKYNSFAESLGVEESELSLTEKLYGKLGGGTEEIVSQSYFNLPIVDRPLKGNSRKAGDISKESQQKIMKKLIDTARQSDMSNREIAIMLASVRHESGFNPDAAARGSSASGLAQFINDTGTSYGINDNNRWDIDMQVQATVDIFNQHFIDIERNNYGEDYVYALHHDGPSLDSGGLQLSKTKVMPFVNDYEKMLENY